MIRLRNCLKTSSLIKTITITMKMVVERNQSLTALQNRTTTLRLVQIFFRLINGVVHSWISVLKTSKNSPKVLRSAIYNSQRKQDSRQLYLRLTYDRGATQGSQQKHLAINYWFLQQTVTLVWQDRISYPLLPCRP